MYTNKLIKINYIPTPHTSGSRCFPPGSNSGPRNAHRDVTIRPMAGGWWESDFSGSEWKFTDRKGKEARTIYVTTVNLYHNNMYILSYFYHMSLCFPFILPLSSFHVSLITPLDFFFSHSIFLWCFGFDELLFYNFIFQI